MWFGGRSGDANKVFSFDPASLRATTSSGKGDVSGLLKAKPEVYLGLLSNAAGDRYWVNLDRYTGAFTMGIFEADGSVKQMEFSGKCLRAQRQF